MLASSHLAQLLTGLPWAMGQRQSQHKVCYKLNFSHNQTQLQHIYTHLHTHTNTPSTQLTTHLTSFCAVLANCSHIEKCDNILCCKSVSRILATPSCTPPPPFDDACGAKLSCFCLVGILLRILRAVAAKKTTHTLSCFNLWKLTNNFRHISCIVALKCRINLTAWRFEACNRVD